MDKDKARLIRHGLSIAILSLLLSLAGAEAFLRWVDPTGAYAYRLSIRAMFSYIKPDPRGYTFPPGIHDFVGFTVTIDEDGNRIMPDAVSNCRIAWIGDSVTFGWGVDDRETFAYQIAEAIPDAQFVNAARPAYSARNLRLTAESEEADGFIYIPVFNDNVVAPSWSPEFAPVPLGMDTYLLYGRRGPVRGEAMDWRADLGAMLSEGDWLTLAINEPSLVLDWLTDSQSDVVIIPNYTERISQADGHPSAAGHQGLAVSMLSHVEQFVGEVCE